MEKNIYEGNLNKICKQTLMSPAKKTITIKEPGSAITHFIGMIYAIAFSPMIIYHYVVKNADFISILGIIVFMLSMISLYGASTTYHSVDSDPDTNRKLKKMDHLMIFVLIAGSYTPVCLTAIRGRAGYLLLLVIWCLAFVGMAFKFFCINCPKWISSVIYITMGWVCISVLPLLVKNLSERCMFYLVLGGIIYTVGGLIYCLKLKSINQRFSEFGSHEIFHLFVMGGSLCHFICMYYMIG